MKRIFVCAGMGLARNERINEEARLLGRLLADNKDVVYVQGGSCKGLMGETLNAFLKSSSRVEFLIPEKYYDFDVPELKSIIGEENFKATKTFGEAGRLQAIKECNQIIVLPGGTGTLEELLYVNETSRAQEHKAKIVLVNINGYFNGFLQQVQTMIEQGLSKENVIKFDVVESISQIDFENSCKTL